MKEPEGASHAAGRPYITGYNYIWRSFTCTLIKLNFF